MKSGRLSVSQTGSRSSSIGHSNCAVNPRNLTDDSMVLLDEEGEEGVLVAECKVGKEEREEARDGTMDINAVREVEECQEEARDLYMDTITPGPKRKLADAMGASATPIPTPTRGGSGVIPSDLRYKHKQYVGCAVRARQGGRCLPYSVSVYLPEGWFY